MSRELRLLPIIFLLAGCSTLSQSTSASNPTPSADAPASADKQTAAEAAAIASVLQQLKQKGSDYKIGAADLVEITVYREEELNRTARVSQNGSISLPLVGAVQVGGKTPAEAETYIAGKLKDFLVSPQVTIFIKEYGNKKVFVLGEVTKPGSYELPPESKLTVLEAISLAGGFTQVAAKDRTKVIRTTSDGRSQNPTVEVSAITTRGEKNKDLPLEPNDVVYVPQSFF
ncbi:MAG: polysaccharide biosynthesis/export family protein [Elusimicrobiota bacterium]|jgi:polysaccharide export outer membrane protein